MDAKTPKLPAHLSEYGRICLQALVDAGLGEKISLGGALGLLHYIDYRPTYDVDAWWGDVTNQDRQEVVETIEGALQPFGEVRTRSWGEVVSIELLDETGKAFSFLIARRSAQLEPSEFMPEFEVLIDSFSDLVASKMVALVERGAPRDFRDIYAVCQAQLITSQECWTLGEQRQWLAGSDTNNNRARLAIETHLERITQHRPIEKITDEVIRLEAVNLRTWFRQVFLDATK